MIRESMNDNWIFQKGSTQSLESQISGGAGSGNVVHLPHDAMILEKRDENTPNGVQTGFYPGGDYAYVKKMFVPEEWKEKVVTLEFEGVYTNAKVFINGDLVTISNNGYSNFYVNTKGYLNYGVENEIKVSVNNSTAPNSRWYSGSGIYRPVNLITANLIHIDLDGVKITTPEIDEDLTVVLVETDIENEIYLNEKVIVKTEILDDKGNVVSRDEMVVTLFGSTKTSIRQRLIVENPNLWDCDHPNLYTCKIEIHSEQKVWDLEEINFGIRDIKLDAKKGFRINGKEVNLRGACIHHDNGLIGACTFNRAEERRCEQLKEAGFNTIRISHQPISKAMLEACDRLGLLVIDELSDMWTQAKNLNDYSNYFINNWEIDVELMVKKDFNHPSVIMYCMGNEIQEAGSPRGAEMNRKINNKIHQLDSTRFTTNAINGLLAASAKLPEIFMDLQSKSPQSQSETTTETKQNNNVDQGGSNELNNMMSLLKGPVADAVASHPIMTDTIEEFASSMDVAGFNYMTGRHELEHELHPNRVVMGAETFPSEIARLWNIVKNNSHVIGDMTWTGYDYLGEAGVGIFYYDGRINFGKNWPDSLAYVGDIDITGYRRPMSYYREIVFGLRKKPYIAVQRLNRYGQESSKTPWHFKDSIASWTWAGYEGKPAIVDVFSDADEVELFLNGESKGRKAVGENEEYIATFEMSYEPGELKAISYRSGIVDDECVLKTANDNVTLRIDVDKTHLLNNLNELSYLEIQLVDNQGRENLQEVREISISVEGPISIQGFGSANPQTENYYYNHTWQTWDGRLLAVIRSTNEEGVGKVTLKTRDEVKVVEIIVGAAK